MLHEAKIVPLLTAHPLPCPDCGARLLLIVTMASIGYICENKFRTGCKGNAGAHTNGQPMGEPASKEIRAYRTLVHKVFDPIWKQYPYPTSLKKRAEMMDFLRDQLAKLEKWHPESPLHFSNLDKEQLDIVLHLIQTDLRKEFS